MEAILPLKKIIKRKQKHYKSAIDDHLVTLHKALDRDTQQKLHTLKQRSIAISVPNEYIDDNKIINGFAVADLHDSRVDERIILVQSETKQQVAEGAIVDVGHHEVKIKLDKPLTIAKSNDENESTCSRASSVFKVKFDKQNIIDRKKRIENALRRFKYVSCSLPIHKSLLGDYKDWSNNKFGKARAISLNETLRLKGSQLKAVEESMKKRISLVEGVAGSGKTLVAASLAYSMHRYRNKKTLLCSPIQATVDKLAQMLGDKESALVVKLSPKKRSWRQGNGSSSSEESSSRLDLERCSLDSLIKSEIFKRSWQRTERVSRAPKGSQRQRVLLHKQANRIVSNSSTWRKKQVERKILQRADIICCTLVQAGSPCLRKLNFDMLIIDDLQAAPETDCMIPMMMKGLKQVTLISEMRREIRLARSKRQSIESKQEPNGKISSKKEPNGVRMADIRRHASELVIKQAQEPGGLFERWLSMGLTAVCLRNQFRMHETLAAFSNHHFYLSRLKTDKEANKQLTRQICSDLELGEDKFNWLPNKRCLTAFFDSRTHGGSMDEIVKAILHKLVVVENVHKSRIGLIINERSKKGNTLFDGIEMGTIEDFLGQERDFIILLARNGNETTTTTKINLDNSSTTIDCNYLKDEDALLIAITRARLGQFIVTELLEGDNLDQLISTSLPGLPGTERHMNYCDSWRALVKYYLANKLVIHAPTSDLEQQQPE